VTTSQQFLLQFGQKNDRPGPPKEGADLGRIGPLPIEQIRFSRPAGSAPVTPVGGFDQGDDRSDIAGQSQPIRQGGSASTAEHRPSLLHLWAAPRFGLPGKARVFFSVGGKAADRAPLSDQLDESQAILERVAQGGLGGQAQVQRTIKDGTVVDLLVAYSPVRDSSGALVGMSPVARDITARKAAEMALRDSEDRSGAVAARLAAMVEFSDDAIWSWSLDGTIASWNGGPNTCMATRRPTCWAVTSCGQTPTGSWTAGWIPSGVKNELPDIASRVERGERVRHFETQRIRQDNSVIDGSLTVSPIRDVSGTLTGMSVVARDISERQRHEQTLAEERRRLRAAESIGHVGSWEMDIDQSGRLL
jgi:PAS domain-containing protein